MAADAFQVDRNIYTIIIRFARKMIEYTAICGSVWSLPMRYVRSLCNICECVRCWAARRSLGWELRGGAKVGKSAKNGAIHG